MWPTALSSVKRRVSPLRTMPWGACRKRWARVGWRQSKYTCLYAHSKKLTQLRPMISASSYPVSSLCRIAGLLEIFMETEWRNTDKSGARIYDGLFRIARIGHHKTTCKVNGTNGHLGVGP